MEKINDATVDILDQLENIDGYVRLELASSEIIYGKPKIICWGGEDDLDKEIMFEPYPNPYKIHRFYGREDIVSFEICNEKDIEIVK